MGRPAKNLTAKADEAEENQVEEIKELILTTEQFENLSDEEKKNFRARNGTISNN